MKVLCVCHQGLVRSVTLAAILKMDHHLDAVPVGVWGNTPATLDALCAWADRVYPVNTDECCTDLPASAQGKVTVFPIGGDVYGYPWHAELVKKIRKILTAQPEFLQRLRQPGGTAGAGGRK